MLYTVRKGPTGVLLKVLWSDDGGTILKIVT